MPVLFRSVIAATALVLLAGCSSGSADASGAPVPSSSPVPERPAGRVLTAAQARAAVPPLDVLPGGWRTDPGGGMRSSVQVSGAVQPPRCQPLVDRLYRARSAAAGAVAAAATARYRGPRNGPYLSVRVESYEVVAGDGLDRMARSLADCPRFRTAAGGAEFTATPLSFDSLGDETLALRVLGTAGSSPYTLDFVAARVGHNTVTVRQVSLGATADADVVQEVASAAVHQLPGG
jgi:hypothetical protein